MTIAMKQFVGVLLLVLSYMMVSVHGCPGMAKETPEQDDGKPRVLDAPNLLKMIHALRQDDFRLVRPHPTEATIEQQHAWCPSKLSSLLLTLCTSTALPGKSSHGKMTVSLHQRGLAAEALTMCMMNQPDVRQAAYTKTSFFDDQILINKIQKQQLVADNLSQGLVRIFQDGMQHIREADKAEGEAAWMAMAQAAEALWSSSYHHSGHLQNHLNSQAIDVLAEWIIEASSTKHSTTTTDNDNDNEIAYPFPAAPSVMWSLAALQNMAANYCDNDLGYCIWEWLTADNNKLQVSDDTPLLEAPAALAEQARERIVHYPHLLKTIIDWVCRGTLREKPSDSIGWPGDVTVWPKDEHGNFTLNQASPQLQAPSIVPWAAAGVIKNLLLSTNTTIVKAVKNNDHKLLPCLCDMMVYSPDWLEHGKSVDAIHFWAPPLSSSEDDDTPHAGGLCPGIYESCRDDTQWQNVQTGDTCQEYTLDRWCIEYGDDFDEHGKTANEACCLCGGGYRSLEDVMEDIDRQERRKAAKQEEQEL